MTKVKICGITNSEDAIKACEYGADLVGFIFVQGTPRAVDIDVVKKILVDIADKQVGKTGLFKDHDLKKVIEIISGSDLDHAQLHGNETPEYCEELKQSFAGRDKKIIKTFKVKDKILLSGDFGLSAYDMVDYFIFDAYHPEMAGGTGERFNWDVLVKENENIHKPFFLAGGLTAENVSQAVRTVRPYGVDVSSGVEKAPGKKDENFLKEFIENAKIQIA